MDGVVPHQRQLSLVMFAVPEDVAHGKVAVAICFVQPRYFRVRHITTRRAVIWRPPTTSAVTCSFLFVLLLTIWR